MPAELDSLGVINRATKLVISTNGALAVVTGTSLAVMIAAVHENFSITQKIDQELARREQAGLLPPAPDSHLLSSGVKLVPALESEYVRPIYQHAIATGETSVTIIFPDLIRERQAEIAAVEAMRIRSDERTKIIDELNSTPSLLGYRRDNQNLNVGGVAFITFLFSGMHLFLRGGGQRNKPNSVPEPTLTTE